MVVHLTSIRRAAGPFLWEVDLPRGMAGLRTASTAKCGEVYTLLKEHLREVAGTVPRETMSAIDRALAVAHGNAEQLT